MVGRCMATVAVQCRDGREDTNEMRLTEFITHQCCMQFKCSEAAGRTGAAAAAGFKRGAGGGWCVGRMFSDLLLVAVLNSIGIPGSQLPYQLAGTSTTHTLY